MNTTARVLIVDDDEIMLRHYRRLLASANFAVQVAKSGDEALEILADHAFDVVLLEYLMSGGDGLALLRAIKQLCPHTEVVVITGTPTVKHAKESIRLGACDYLVKPVPPEEVIKAAAGAALQKRWTLHRIAGQDTLRITH